MNQGKARTGVYLCLPERRTHTTEARTTQTPWLNQRNFGKKTLLRWPPLLFPHASTTTDKTTTSGDSNLTLQKEWRNNKMKTRRPTLFAAHLWTSLNYPPWEKDRNLCMTFKRQKKWYIEERRPFLFFLFLSSLFLKRPFLTLENPRLKDFHIFDSSLCNLSPSN